MIALIEDNREAIAELCERYGVRRLSVFGLAAKGSFDPATSDIDFPVDLGDYDSRGARRFMRFIVALEEPLGHSVHVTTSRSVESEWFRKEPAETGRTIHAADTPAAAC